MTPLTIIQRAGADGVKLALSPTGTIKASGNQEAVHRWIPLIRQHKPGIVAALSGQPINTPNVVAPISPAECGDDGNWHTRNIKAVERRQRLLAMLERSPNAQYAVLTSDDNKGPVVVAIAKRGGETVELEIERSRYDAVLLLELVERHTGTVH